MSPSILLEFYYLAQLTTLKTSVNPDHTRLRLQMISQTRFNEFLCLKLNYLLLVHGAGTLTLNRRKDTEEIPKGQTDFGEYVYSELILDLKAIEEYIDVNSKLRKRLLLKGHGHIKKTD